MAKSSASCDSLLKNRPTYSGQYLHDKAFSTTTYGSKYSAQSTWVSKHWHNCKQVLTVLHYTRYDGGDRGDDDGGDNDDDGSSDVGGGSDDDDYYRGKVSLVT